jgi:hypothetical protein
VKLIKGKKYTVSTIKGKVLFTGTYMGRAYNGLAFDLRPDAGTTTVRENEVTIKEAQ